MIYFQKMWFINGIMTIKNIWLINHIVYNSKTPGLPKKSLFPSPKIFEWRILEEQWYYLHKKKN